MRRHHAAFVSVLALAAALPCPALRVGTRAPDGTSRPSAGLAAGDHELALAALPAAPQPLCRGERVGPDGASHPVATPRSILVAKPALSAAAGLGRAARAACPTCASLCRFQV